MRKGKRISWTVIGIACAATLIGLTSGATPSRERQAEEAVNLGDADTLLRLIRDGLDPKTEVCTFYTTPDLTDAFPLRLLPDSVFPKVYKAKSPLIVEAVRSAKGPSSQTLVAELLQHGADCNAQSNAGDSPLFAAVETGNGEMTGFLLDHGASLNTSDARRAFYEALRTDHTYIVRLFLTRGQSPQERFAYDNHKTPLMVAAQSGVVKSVELLLERGAFPNAQDADGETALGIALCNDYGNNTRRTTKMLLRHGASLFLKNHDGVTPFDRLSFMQDFYKATGQTYKIPRILPGPPPP